jgi:branched-chain amino acid transport system substrate-binding protein
MRFCHLMGERLALFLRRGMVLAGVLALLPTATLHAEDGVQQGEILVGAIGALTGPLAFVGAPGRDGLTIGFDEINSKGGVHGRKIRMVFEHALSPAESIAAVKKLVEQDKVFALILASGSTGAAAAADYVRANGVPTYNLFGSTPIIREPFARNVFHGAIVPADIQAAALIEQVYDGGYPAKKVGVLAGTYAFPQSTLVEVKKALEARKIDHAIEQFDQASRDFTAQIVSLTRAKVDAIIILGSFSEAGFAIKQAHEMGLSRLRFVVDGSAVNRAIVPIIGNAEGIRGYFSGPHFPGEDARPIQEFEARLKQFLGGTIPQGRPNAYDVIGYGSAFVLTDALHAAGRNLTREGLLSAWSQLKNAGPDRMGGLPIIFPESFAPGDHQGNKRLGGTIIRNGNWKVERVIEPPK